MATAQVQFWKVNLKKLKNKLRGKTRSNFIKIILIKFIYLQIQEKIIKFIN